MQIMQNLQIHKHMLILKSPTNQKWPLRPCFLFVGEGEGQKGVLFKAKWNESLA